jgi:hypothetical protein
VSSEVLGALAKNLADTLDGSDRSRALAEAAVGRIADLADALRDPGECASFLIGMVRAGQGPRTAALALDHSRTTTTRLSALDALDNDESWRVLEDTASRLLDYAVSGAGVRLRAVELLESVARRGEADRDAIVARLRTAATRDASPEVRAAARRVAEQLTKN